MQIDGFSGKSSIVGSPLQKATRNDFGGSETAAALENSASYLPTGDVTVLLNALNQVPLLREDVVAEAEAKLRAGELNTPETRAETVKAILGVTLSNT